MTPESKKPYHRRAYQKAFFGTITANVRREFKREFADLCEDNGTTINAVLKAAAEEYVRRNSPALSSPGNAGT